MKNTTSYTPATKNTTTMATVAKNITLPPSCTLDQQQPSVTSLALGFSFGTTNNQKVAQSWKPSFSGGLCSIEVKIVRNTDVTDRVGLQIYDDNGGVPGSVIATADNTADGAGLSENIPHTILSFDFSSRPFIVAETVYWFVLERTGALDNNEWYNAAYDGGAGNDTYTRGEIYYYNSLGWVRYAAEVGGDTWDLYFKEYVDNSVTSSSLSKPITTHATISKPTTPISVPGVPAATRLDSSTVTLDSLTVYLHGYSTVTPPNQFGKNVTSYANV